MMKTTPLHYLFFCSIAVVVWLIPFSVSSEYSFDQPTVIQTTETGELVNLDESLIRLLNESIHSLGIVAGATAPAGVCNDCEFSDFFGNIVDARAVFKRQGRCFAVVNAPINPRFVDRGVRTSCNAEGICCDSQSWVATSYFTYFSNLGQEWEKAIGDCVATCSDPEDCLVLYGHSFSGSLIEFAGFVLSKYKPIVFMTGGLPGFADGCPSLNATKFFHIENSFTFIPSNLLAVDSTMYLGNTGRHAGHRILLSKETNAVSYWGFNQPLPGRVRYTTLIPFRREDVIVTSSVCHSLFDSPYSYAPSLYAVIDRGIFPIPFGWDDGAPCSRNIDCKSGNCDGLFCGTQQGSP